MVRKRVELLAPAGNAEGFYGAVHAGADAVYLGGSRFGARAYAENFTGAELVECIRYGHLMGRRVYLTVNTLLKEGELGELYDYLYPFYEAGLDAVIVQDMGVLGFVGKYFPALELHASTQMTLCSHYGAELLKELGASRVVPSRELSLQELSEIRNRVDIELETFIHGAMCYCYSGQCLFSSILGGRSGNRGRCAQPCRLPYRIRTDREQSEECYPLSLKDMCTIEHIPLLIEAGIDSFKIEGRMKKPEYAAGVTAVYRRYIDLYYELRETLGKEQAAEQYKVSRKDLEALSSLYIRSGKQDGYYFKHNGRDMVTLSNPAYSGNDDRLLDEIRAGYLSGRLKLPVKVTASFVTGMPAEVTLQTEELSVTVRGEPVDRARKQPVTEENVRKQLGRMGDTAFIPEYMEVKTGKDAFYPLKQINELRREAVLQLEQLILERNAGRDKKTLCAEKFPAGRDFEDKDHPSGGDFEDKDHPAGRGFEDKDHPVGRDFEDKDHPAGRDFEGKEKCPADRDIRDKGNYPVDRKVQGKASFPDEYRKETAAGIVVSVRTLEQLQGAAGYLADHAGKSFKRLYIDGDLLLDRTQETVSLCGKLQDTAELYIALPYILRREDDTYLEAVSELADRYPFFRGMLVRSLDELSYVHKNGYHNRLDAGVYCWNSLALEELQAMSAGFCLPLELKAGEQRKLLDACRNKFGGRSFEKLVYGRIPMMITANCVLKTTGSCRRESASSAVLIDRYRKEFPVIRICRHCMNIIYNSVPLSLHQTVMEWQGRTDIRLDFTIENGRETVKVLEAFFDQGVLPYDEYTTGHEKRGVE